MRMYDIGMVAPTLFFSFERVPYPGKGGRYLVRHNEWMGNDVTE